MWRLNGQILQQPQMLRDFPIQYQADEFEDVSSDPVDHQHGVLHERPLTWTESPKVFQTLFQVPKLLWQRARVKLRGVEDKMQKEGYKHKTNKN